MSLTNAPEISASPVSASKPATGNVLDTTFRVATPENISFEYRLAGPFPRILAYLLDVLVSVVAYGVFVFVFWLVFIFAITPLAKMVGLSGVLDVLKGMALGLTLVGYFVVYWFYGAVTETYLSGQTLGKRWTNLRVLTVEGHSIDGVQATLRNFFRLLDISPIVPFSTLFPTEVPIMVGIPTCLFGLILMTISSRYQRVGDLVAGTIVINEQLPPVPGVVKFSDTRVPQLAELIPDSVVLSRQLSKTLSQFVEQRQWLPPDRVSEIAGHVAAPLLDRWGMARDTNYDLLLCALYYKTFVASEHEEFKELP